MANLVGRDFVSMFVLDERRNVLDVLAKARDGGQPDGEELRLMTPAGEARPVAVHAAPVQLASGVFVHVQVVDRRREVAREAHWRRLALFDELRGLLNRRGFAAAAEQLLRVARRDGRDVSFLFLDMEGLKSINDRLGHGAGDDAIREASRIIRRVFRDADAVGRYGGDEFCVLGLTRGPGSAAALLARLEATIENHRHRGEFTLALTAGLVHRAASEVGSLEELMADADAAMYARRQQDAAG